MNTRERVHRRIVAMVAGLVFAAGAFAVQRDHSATHPSAAELERRLSGPDAGPETAREAFVACRSIAASFDGRDVARFLDQYGRAAARSGEPEIAAVMFARCFLLHPSSRWAPSSLLESAILHRHVFDDEAVAQRLARRSLATARALAMLEAIAAAEAFLSDSKNSANSSSTDLRSPPPRSRDVDRTEAGSSPRVLNPEHLALNFSPETPRPEPRVPTPSVNLGPQPRALPPTIGSATRITSSTTSAARTGRRKTQPNSMGPDDA